MALEKPSFRDNLMRIKEFYPNKELLNKKEVAKYCGIDQRTVAKLFEFNNGYMSVVNLARAIS